MKDYPAMIESLDLRVFDAIKSETSDDDKKSLLLLQNCIRKLGNYCYLEIGSHLGGSLQPYYLDPYCKRIFSIDKRPNLQPDERGKVFEYPENSSARMMNNLLSAFPSISLEKIVIFSSDAIDVDQSQINLNLHRKKEIHPENLQLKRQCHYLLPTNHQIISLIEGQLFEIYFLNSNSIL